MDESDCIRHLFSLTGVRIEAVTAAAATVVYSAPTAGQIFGDILLILLLVLLNGLFAAAEMAVISLNKNKIERQAEEGDRIALRLQRLIANSGRFLASIQVGVTLTGFLSSAFAANRFATYLAYLIDPSGTNAWIESISIIFVTLILSFISLIFGELVPKQIALRHPETLSRRLSGTMRSFNVIFLPLTKLLDATTRGVLRLFGIKPDDAAQNVTEEEIRIMVDVGLAAGSIHSSEVEMIENVFEFNDKEVSEIMTHRTNVVALEIEAEFDEIIDVAVNERFSRIPVYRETIDDIIGVLYVKDMMRHTMRVAERVFKQQTDDSEDSRTVDAGSIPVFRLEEIIREPFFVPESKNINDLFFEMQHRRIQMAIVIDEYGGTAGIVTIEDLLEEIVGNIQDEYDEEDLEIVENPDGSWTIDGLTDLTEASRKIPDFVYPEEDDDYDTVAGYVIGLLGYIPDADCEEPVSVQVGRMKFTVLQMEEKRIARLRLEFVPEPEEAEDDAIDESERGSRGATPDE